MRARQTGRQNGNQVKKACFSKLSIDEVRGRSSQLSSTLSKGVHWEFFTTVLVYDESTIKAAIRDTCILVGTLGLTSHFVPTAYASLRPEDAMDAYLSFRKELT